MNAAFEAIASDPQAAPRCDNIRAGYRRHWVEQHVAYFRVEAGAVVVVRVLHQRMDAPRHL